MNIQTTPPTRSKKRFLPANRLLALTTLAFVSALLSLLTACQLVEAAIAPLPTAAVSAAGEVQFVLAGTPLAVVGTPAGFVPAALGSPLDPTATPTPSMTPTATPDSELGPPLPPPTIVAANPPIDFAAARATAQAQGLDIAFTKIGFHTGGSGGNTSGLEESFRRLDAAGVPIFLKSVDDPGYILKAQNLMIANETAGRDVPHVLVYRLTDGRYEAPFYNPQLSPEEAAAVSWELNRNSWHSDLNKKYIWFETLNEPGRSGDDGNLQIERLGRFSLATAKLAVAQGYRYAALSFSTGVPEPIDWEDPAMLEFLRYAGEHPDQVAVALHEYSLTIDYIAPPRPANPNEPHPIPYPYLVGRFQSLFEVCDKYGIPRPTILITEWGWEYNNVPDPGPAMEDLAWSSWLYAAYPTVKGANIWYLGSQFGGIANRAQQLIAPLTNYAISHYFIYHPGLGEIDAEIFRPSQPTLLLPDSFDNWATPFPRPRQMP
ncbi:MAG: hypothetical protein KBG73_08725 [Candidatus Promineofilum sp.]|nr:hypothetical protein [Promineifilum sp.]